MSITRQLIKHVRDLAEANPSFVYSKGFSGRCVYQVDGVASCLIGQAAHKAGVPMDVLQTWDTGQGFVGSGAISVLPSLGIEGHSLDWLAQVQSMQDGGSSWETAVAQADRNPLFRAGQYR